MSIGLDSPGDDSEKLYRNILQALCPRGHRILRNHLRG
jgi:hypothetical protein